MTRSADARRRLAAEWPECETTEALEARDARRRALADIAAGVIPLAGLIAVWQGLEMYAVATLAAA